MAQPAQVTIHLDVTAARKKVRRLMALAREANAEMARLDEQFTVLMERAEELRAFGIQLEVTSDE